MSARRRAHPILRACARGAIRRDPRKLAPHGDPRRKQQALARFDVLEREVLGLMEPGEVIRAAQLC